jgi:quercetin dioxygenase-like cupin family protein
MSAEATVLPRAICEELLTAFEPQPPPAPVARRMLGAIRARLDLDAAPPVRTLRRDDGWKPMAAGIERKVLFDDGATVSWLMKMTPGAQLPEHTHDDGVEECLVLEGEVRFGGERYGAGDYVRLAQGSRHAVTYSDAGATIFLRTPSRRTGARDYACPR